MGVVNTNDRNCIRTYPNVKRKYDRACIQRQSQRLFEVQEDSSERGKSRASCVFLSKSKSTNRNIHGSKENS